MEIKQFLATINPEILNRDVEIVYRDGVLTLGQLTMEEVLRVVTAIEGGHRAGPPRAVAPHPFDQLGVQQDTKPPSEAPKASPKPLSVVPAPSPELPKQPAPAKAPEAKPNEPKQPAPAAKPVQAPAKPAKPSEAKSAPTKDAPETVTLPEGGQLLLWQDGSRWFTKRLGEEDAPTVGPFATRIAALTLSGDAFKAPVPEMPPSALPAGDAPPHGPLLAPAEVAQASAPEGVAKAVKGHAEGSVQAIIDEGPPAGLEKLGRPREVVQYLYDHGFKEQRDHVAILTAWHSKVPCLAKVRPGSMPQIVEASWAVLRVEKANAEAAG